MKAKVNCPAGRGAASVVFSTENANEANDCRGADSFPLGTIPNLHALGSSDSEIWNQTPSMTCPNL